MNKATVHVLLFLVLVTLEGCIKPFDADSLQYDRAIVVEGLITNEDKIHSVKHSYTYPINDRRGSKLSGAQVWVEDGSGEKIDYAEAEPGYYQSQINFAASIDKEYSLVFVTEEGDEYRSQESSLINPAPIDSIYAKYAELPIDGLAQNLPGVQIFIDSHDENKSANYFRYEWEQHYKIVSPFPSLFIFVPPRGTADRIESTHICYEGNKSKSMILATSLGAVENRISEAPINFVASDSDYMRNRYTILVKQYSISEEAYSFYSRFRDSNESGGSLFDQQQGTIVGNVRPVDNPSQRVLGYFEVSGVSEKRKFFNYSDFSDQLQRPAFRYDCPISDMVTSSLDSLPIILAAYTNYQIVRVENRVLYASRKCTDCTWYASKEKPDFWID